MAVSNILVPVSQATVAITGPAGARGTRVDLDLATNATWDDAFQFGIPGDTSWSFSGVTFLLDVKQCKDGPALLALSTGGGTIVTTDVTNRILAMNVPDTSVQALGLGHFEYDLVMVTTATGVRDILMHGDIHVVGGVTD